MKKQQTKFSFSSVLPFFFFCQLVTLGLLRQTPSYSFWEAEIAAYPSFSLWISRVITVLVLFGVALFLHRGKRYPTGRLLIFSQGFFLIAGFVLTFYFAKNLPTYIIGQVCIGIAHPLILVCWAAYLAKIPKRQRNKCIALSALLAALFFWAIGIAPDSLKSFLFLFAVLGSILPLVFLDRTENGHRDTEPLQGKTMPTSLPQALSRSTRAITWELIVLMACYSLLFRIMIFFDFSSGDDFSVFFWGVIIRIGGMALLAAYLSRKQFEPNVQQVVLPLFFLTIIGLIFLPNEGGLFGSFSIAAVNSSWTFFYTIIWLILFEAAQEKSLPRLPVFVWGWTIMNILLLLAVPIAAIFEKQVSGGTLSLTALIIIVIYTLVVGLLLFRKSLSKRPEDPLSDQKISQKEAYQQIAETHELTKRETEIFIMLAQGYSLPAIEDHFVLSHSTVKGHARHIYEKFEVKNKQELIKLVNEEQPLP